MLSPHAGFNKHCSLMAVPILAMVAESTPGVKQRLDNLNNNPIREVPIRRQAGLLAIPGTWRSVPG